MTDRRLAPCLFALVGLAVGCSASTVVGDVQTAQPDFGVSPDATPDKPLDVIPSPGNLLIPRSVPSLIFEVRGRIDHDEKPEPRAAGRLEAVTAAGQSQFDEQVRIYRRSGQTSQRVVIEATRTDPSSSHAVLRRQLARVILDADALSKGPVDISPTEGVQSASLHQQTIIQRADGVVFGKDCYSALLDLQDSDSRVRVAAPWATTHLGAEDFLYAWGNLALITEPALLLAAAARYGIVEHQGLPCGCFVDGEPLDCPTWELQARQNGIELDCPLPAGFPATKPGAVRMVFKGPIGSDQQVPPGLARVEVEIDDKLYQLGASSTAHRYIFASGVWKGKPVVEVRSYGTVEPAGPKRQAFDMLVTRLPLSLLAGLKKAGSYHRPPGLALDLFTTLGRVEQAEVDGELLTRFCALAISDVTASELYLCHDHNQSFAADEQLQLAASVGLTNDPDALAAMLGDDTCFCSVDGAAIDCNTFPEP